MVKYDHGKLLIGKSSRKCALHSVEAEHNWHNPAFFPNLDNLLGHISLKFSKMLEKP